MRFPLRLGAELHRRDLVRFLGSFADAPPVFRYSPLLTHLPEGFRSGQVSADSEWHSPEECVQAVEDFRSPVVWLGGVEPLLHPEIGLVASALVETQRYVFLHTRGHGLRKRIHEFRPHSRLYFALECALGSESNGSEVTQSLLSKTLEAIRAAKLSGFYVSGHVTIDAKTDLADFQSLLGTLRSYDLDGCVVSSGSVIHSRSSEELLSEKLSSARAMIDSPGWRRFSCLLEESRVAPQRETAKIRRSGANAYEEGA